MRTGDPSWLGPDELDRLEKRAHLLASDFMELADLLEVIPVLVQQIRRLRTELVAIRTAGAERMVTDGTGRARETDGAHPAGGASG